MNASGRQKDVLHNIFNIFKWCNIFYFISLHLLSTSIILLLSWWDFLLPTQNINLLQENRNFLTFNISSSFGSHGQYSNARFPSHCSVYWSESDSEEQGKASASAAAEIQAEIQPVLPSSVPSLLPWKERAAGKTSQPQIWAECDLPFNTGNNIEPNSVNNKPRSVVSYNPVAKNSTAWKVPILCLNYIFKVFSPALDFLKLLSLSLLVSQSLPATFLREMPLFSFLWGKRLPYSG